MNNQKKRVCFSLFAIVVSFSAICGINQSKAVVSNKVCLASAGAAYALNSEGYTGAAAACATISAASGGIASDLVVSGTIALATGVGVPLTGVEWLAAGVSTL